MTRPYPAPHRPVGEPADPSSRDAARHSIAIMQAALDQVSADLATGTWPIPARLLVELQLRLSHAHEVAKNIMLRGV